jgi:signal transduction histidine kinase
MKPAQRPFFDAASARPCSLAAPSGVPDEPALTVASRPAGTAQKIIAALSFSALLAVFMLISLHPDGLRLKEAGAFLPACGTAMFVISALTAALLFAQSAITRPGALLVLACGYLFTALIMIPWMITAPDVEGAAWLSLFSRAGFALCVIAYALRNDREQQAGAYHPSQLIGGASLAVVAAAIVALLASRTISGLPPPLHDPQHLTVAGLSLAGGVTLLTILALAALWRHLPSVLDLWLMIVMSAWTLQILLVFFPVPARFTPGWYGGQLFALIAGSIVLVLLLCEIMSLYPRLFAALRAKRHEHEARLLTGNAVAAMIAHEIKQPLTGITTHAQAGLRWLDRPIPELDEARDALRHITANGVRTGELIDNVRSSFRRNAESRVSLAPEPLIADVLTNLRTELRRHRIRVDTVFDPDLPTILGDPSLLRQCLANLVTNAIDAMAETAGPRTLSVHASFRDDGVRISVADSGPGIRPEDADRIFNPLFTSKLSGAGMGLSICRSIIDSHDGKLWVAPNPPRGAIFHVALRAAVENRQ